MEPMLLGQTDSPPTQYDFEKGTALSARGYKIHNNASDGSCFYYAIQDFLYLSPVEKHRACATAREATPMRNDPFALREIVADAFTAKLDMCTKEGYELTRALHLNKTPPNRASRDGEQVELVSLLIGMLGYMDNPRNSSAAHTARHVVNLGVDDYAAFVGKTKKSIDRVRTERGDYADNGVIAMTAMCLNIHIYMYEPTRDAGAKMQLRAFAPDGVYNGFGDWTFPGSKEGFTLAPREDDDLGRWPGPRYPDRACIYRTYSGASGHYQFIGPAAGTVGEAQKILRRQYDYGMVCTRVVSCVDDWVFRRQLAMHRKCTHLKEDYVLDTAVAERCVKTNPAAVWTTTSSIPMCCVSTTVSGEMAVLGSGERWTGGDLFGMWATETACVVQMATGPGRKALCGTRVFEQDSEFFRQSVVVGKALGCVFVGRWISRPAGGADMTEYIRSWLQERDTAANTQHVFVDHVRIAGGQTEHHVWTRSRRTGDNGRVKSLMWYECRDSTEYFGWAAVQTTLLLGELRQASGGIVLGDACGYGVLPTSDVDLMRFLRCVLNALEENRVSVFESRLAVEWTHDRAYLVVTRCADNTSMRVDAYKVDRGDVHYVLCSSRTTCTWYGCDYVARDDAVSAKDSVKSVVDGKLLEWMDECFTHTTWAETPDGGVFFDVLKQYMSDYGVIVGVDSSGKRVQVRGPEEAIWYGLPEYFPGQVRWPGMPDGCLLVTERGKQGAHALYAGLGVILS